MPGLRRSALSRSASGPSLVARLAKTGLRRGFVEGSRAWLYVGVTATALRIAHRILVQPPETVYLDELKPGEAIEIRTVRPKG
jgi:hypothetical protein